MDDNPDSHPIRVGHLDTGIEINGSDLLDYVAAFAHFDRNGERAAATQPFDSGRHGTFTAGIIHCLAPQARFCSAIVIEGGNTIVRVLMGMAWLLEQNVRVLSLPLGVPGHNPVFRSLIAALRQQGVLTVAPIGNRGAGQSHAPANYEGVLSVGVVDKDGLVPAFSGSHNDPQTRRCLKPDIVAPGVDIRSCLNGDPDKPRSGTSMASAYAAGVAALLFQARPEATPNDVENAILNTSTPLSKAQSHRVRCGQINVEAALDYLVQNKGHGQIPSPPKRMGGARYVDPYLIYQLRYLHASAHIEAVLVLDQVPPQEFIEQITNGMGYVPRRVRLIPDGNIVIILAEAQIIKQLVDHEHVRAASATNISSTSFDRFG